jgi:hypothetical protein
MTDPLSSGYAKLATGEPFVVEAMLVSRFRKSHCLVVTIRKFPAFPKLM